MKPEQFWQNFELGVEIDIASTFLYDGLNNLHQMDTFHYETEIFNFLYNVSVGVERFLKVAIILQEFSDETDAEEFEKSLITHNHSDLLSRLNKSCKLNLGKPHIEFISLLAKFYKSFRYDRYSLNTVYDLAKEKDALISFLSKHIELEKHDEVVYKNNSCSRNYIGKLLSKIILQTYEIETQ